MGYFLSSWSISSVCYYLLSIFLAICLSIGPSIFLSAVLLSSYWISQNRLRLFPCFAPNKHMHLLCFKQNTQNHLHKHTLTATTISIQGPNCLIGVTHGQCLNGLVSKTQIEFVLFLPPSFVLETKLQKNPRPNHSPKLF